MKLKIALVFFAFLIGTAAASEDAGLEKMTLYELVKSRQDGFSKSLERISSSGPASKLSSARINLYVGAEAAGIVLENGKITEVVNGKLENPTVEFKTSRGFFASILKSNNPAKRINYGIKNAFIVMRWHGLINKAKGRIVSEALDKLDVPEQKIEKKIEERIEKIATKKGADTVEITPRALGLEKTGIELKGKGIEDKKIRIEEYTGYADAPPPGISKIELASNEGALGAYVKIEAPEVKADEVLIRLAYTDEELDYKFLDENSLTLKWYDDKTGSWKSISAGNPEWVKEVGINKEENYIYAKLKHFSVYGLAGSVTTPEKIEEQRSYEPAYFESKKEVEEIRSAPKTKGIISRIIGFVLGLFIK